MERYIETPECLVQRRRATIELSSEALERMDAIVEARPVAGPRLRAAAKRYLKEKPRP